MKKIAIPVTEAGILDDHFGHCEFYQIYQLDDQGQILNMETIKSNKTCGCKSNIAEVLATKGVGLMLAGGIGAGAINTLQTWDIQVLRGCSGKAMDLIKQYAEGKLTDSGTSCAQHENHHQEGHQCGH